MQQLTIFLVSFLQYLNRSTLNALTFTILVISLLENTESLVKIHFLYFITGASFVLMCDLNSDF